MYLKNLGIFVTKCADNFLFCFQTLFPSHLLQTPFSGFFPNGSNKVWPVGSVGERLGGEKEEAWVFLLLLYVTVILWMGGTYCSLRGSAAPSGTHPGCFRGSRILHFLVTPHPSVSFTPRVVAVCCLAHLLASLPSLFDFFALPSSVSTSVY